MKLATGLCLALTIVAVAASEFFSYEELNSMFEQFKADFSRNYPSPQIETERKSIFASNLAYIYRHNHDYYLGRHTYLLGINNFTDLTNSEFVARFNKLKLSSTFSAPQTHLDDSTENLPSSVDWTTHNPPVVTGVKDQGDCGGCWAFSATGSIEGQHALKTGKLVSLSEQNLIDCSWWQNNMGCLGGLMDQAFNYVISNGGIDTEASYPYSGDYFDGCVYSNKTIGATISSYVNITFGSESSLQNAVATVGPVSIGIDANHDSFQHYKSGVYNEPACSSTELDHGVLAVGYGSLNGLDFWKVKNSWGTSWGEAGYILMSRNKDNQCGVASQASYPVV